MILLLIVVAAAVTISIVSIVGAPGPKLVDGVPDNNSQVVKAGKIVCLPHKNSDGPHTLECAMGLHDDKDNTYYALKDEQSAQGQSLLNDVSDKRVEVTGIFTLRDDKTYDIVGEMTIEKLKVVN